QGRRHALGVREEHVVVRQAVYEHHRTFQLRGLRQQRATTVGLRLRVGGSQVALGVVGVVQLPVDDGGTGDGGVEHVGTTQHRQGGQVAAERPPLNTHA